MLPRLELKELTMLYFYSLVPWVGQSSFPCSNTLSDGCYFRAIYIDSWAFIESTETKVKYITHVLLQCWDDMKRQTTLAVWHTAWIFARNCTPLWSPHFYSKDTQHISNKRPTRVLILYVINYPLLWQCTTKRMTQQLDATW